MEAAFVKFAAQNGPWAAFCVLMFVASVYLLKWVLSESCKRETSLSSIIHDQNVVINKQSEALESQSKALNRVTDRLEDLSNCVQRIEKLLDKGERP